VFLAGEAMMDDELRPDSAHRRSGAVAWRMAHGWTPTTRQVATMCGLSMGGAWKMMNEMSTEIPITLGPDRRWRDITIKP